MVAVQCASRLLAAMSSAALSLRSHAYRQLLAFLVLSSLLALLQLLSLWLCRAMLRALAAGGLGGHGALAARGAAAVCEPLLRLYPIVRKASAAAMVMVKVPPK